MKDGCKERRYSSRSWDKKYEAVLSTSDRRGRKKGSLLVADYGKGKFIYTGLSFFRELPEGVLSISFILNEFHIEMKVHIYVLQ